jgi:uncharacterized membrane protein (DUF4010 family)
MSGNKFAKFTKESKQITGEVKEKSIGYLVAALSFVAGLAWNDAIKAMIDFFFPGEQNTLLAKFIYALAITIIVGLVAVYLVRLSKENEKNKKLI